MDLKEIQGGLITSDEAGIKVLVTDKERINAINTLAGVLADQAKAVKALAENLSTPLQVSVDACDFDISAENALGIMISSDNLRNNSITNCRVDASKQYKKKTAAKKTPAKK